MTMFDRDLTSWYRDLLFTRAATRQAQPSDREPADWLVGPACDPRETAPWPARRSSGARRRWQGSAPS